MLVARCAGLDVHTQSVVVCALVGEADAVVVPEVATFGTMTVGLERWAAWLAARGVAEVVMEATGVYWKPSANVLERHGGFRLVVGNAEHLKAVPGRKTDVTDAVWLARLLRHGLVRPSFIPDQAQRERREVTRYRTALIRERASEVNRLPTTLEAAKHFRRRAARRGTKRALVAVGHSILVIAYHLLARGTRYQDLGPEHVDRRDADRVKRRSIQRLEALGYTVSLERQEDAA